jgi:ribosomal protein S27AE
MNEESIQETAKENHLQAEQASEAMGIGDDIVSNMEWKSKWWGFELHFNHLSMDALNGSGTGDTIIELLTTVVGKVVPEPAGTLISAIIELRWEAMKHIDQQTCEGVKLVSPWIALGMLIPLPRRDIPAERLWWLVYGDPQASFAFREGGETSVFADPSEVFLLDTAGGDWGEHQAFQGEKSQSGASLAVYNDNLYCVVHGAYDDFLLYCVYDGEKNWRHATRFPDNAKTNANPALATYNNRLHCVFCGTDSSLYHKVLDGSNWVGHSKIVPSVGPGVALAMYNNRLHCVFRGTDSSLYHKVLEGSNWDGHSKIVDTTEEGSSLATYNNSLYCVFRGTDQKLYQKVFNGSSWSSHTSIGSSAGKGPALANYQGYLHCVFRGKDDANLYHKFFNGSSWSGHRKLAPSTNGQPALAVYHDRHTNRAQLFCVIRGN